MILSPSSNACKAGGTMCFSSNWMASANAVKIALAAPRECPVVNNREWWGRSSSTRLYTSSNILLAKTALLKPEWTLQSGHPRSETGTLVTSSLFFFWSWCFQGLHQCFHRFQGLPLSTTWILLWWRWWPLVVVCCWDWWLAPPCSHSCWLSAWTHWPEANSCLGAAMFSASSLSNPCFLFTQKTSNNRDDGWWLMARFFSGKTHRTRSDVTRATSPPWNYNTVLTYVCLHQVETAVYQEERTT